MTAGEILAAASIAPDGSTAGVHLLNLDGGLVYKLNSKLQTSSTLNVTTPKSTSGLLSLSSNINNISLRTNVETLTATIKC